MKVSCLPSNLPCFAPTRSLTIRSRLTFLTENAKYSRELEAAVDVVQRACRLCVGVQKQLFSNERSVLKKGDRTPVTVADFGVQALISMELGRLFPSIPLVAEEDSSQLQLDLENFQQNGASNSLVETVMNAVTNSQSLQAEPLNYNQILKAIDRGGHLTTSEEKPATYWVLDPIDGTRGFVRGGKALYVVGLALVVEGTPTLGVMGCPNWDGESTYILQNLAKETSNKKELEDFIVPGIIMAACYGCGTWIKKNSYNTRSVALDGSNNGWLRCAVDKCDSIQAARFCIADRETWELLPLSKNLAAGVISVDGVKSWKPTIVPTCCGSLCKYMMVATGRASVYPLQITKQSSEKVWDHAAGMICVLEAGGEVLIHREISMAKFMRLIREGIVMVNMEEVRCGNACHQNNEDAKTFLRALNGFQRSFKDVTGLERPRESQHQGPQGNEDVDLVVDEVMSNVQPPEREDN